MSYTFPPPAATILPRLSISSHRAKNTLKNTKL